LPNISCLAARVKGPKPGAPFRRFLHLYSGSSLISTNQFLKFKITFKMKIWDVVAYQGMELNS